MSEFLSILIGIVVIANFVFTIWSYISLRRIVNWSRDSNINDNILLNHIVHTRSSINLIYASIATITFVLAFLGFNLKDKVTQEVTKEISASARIDLGLLKTKTNEIELIIDSVANIKGKELNLIDDKARSLFNEFRRIQQNVYVIQELQVSPNKHYFKFSELQTINNEKLPYFSQQPAVFNSVAYMDYGIIGSVRINVTKEGIDFLETSSRYKVDLCIYPRKE
jgi:hypothetical protein